MSNLRNIIAVLLLSLAVLAIVVPLPDEGKEHLLTEAETSDTTLTVFSDRDPSLIAPLVEQFEADTGIQTRFIAVQTDSVVEDIRKADLTADVFLSEDSRAMTLLSDAALLDALPRYLTTGLDERFIFPEWAGVSARVDFLVSPAPNQPAARISAALLLKILEQNPDFPFVYVPADLAVSSMAIFAHSDSKPLAQQFISYLYFPAGQMYFRDTVHEYPLMPGMESDQRLMPLSEILPTIEANEG